MKLQIVFCCVLFLLFSCNSSESEESTKDDFVADTIAVPIEFSPYSDANIPDILAEANICANIPKDSLGDTINMFNPPCMANFFNVFKVNESRELNQVFGVRIASGVHDFPIRRTILMVKEGKAWVVMNRFVGDLVEMRTSKSGYHDLLIRHPDMEAGSFAVKYVYDDGKYKPHLAEEVNDALIKKELVDSLTPVIIDRLEKKKMFQ